jgi:ElaB/YqjD/DUF883 family membrane-anchored ribosome-binding protein
MSKLAEYAETLYRVLRTKSRDSYDEIRDAMEAEWSRISTSLVNATIHWVRTHPDEAGYNIGYVKRGSAAYWDTGGRYFIINEEDTTFKLSDDQRDHLDQGFLSMIATIQTLLHNKAMMLDAEQVHETSRIQRECLADLQDDLNTATRKMVRMMRAVRNKRNGTDG